MISRIQNKQVRTVFYSVLIFFCIFIAWPAFTLLKNAFEYRHSFSFVNFNAVFSGGKIWSAFFNSCKVSIISSVITTVFAFVMAYTVTFTNIPSWLKKTFRTLAVFPMLLPTITYGFAIIYSFGKNGLLTKILGFQFFDFYGFYGLIFGYVVYTFPISFTLIKNTMEYIDRRFIVVCRVMGDNSIKTFFTAILGPLAGTIAVSVVQSFFLAFTDFGIPASIGGRYTVISTMLYNTMLGSLPDFHQGAVIALFMLVPSIFSILLLNYLQRFNVRYNKLSNDAIKANPVRDIACSLVSFVVVFAIISIFIVVICSPFVKAWPYDTSFSLDNFTSVLGDKSLNRVFANSLVISLLTAVFGTGLVFASALCCERNKNKLHGTKTLVAIAQVSNAIPGMVLGIAFLLTFRKTPIHNTLIIIVACNLIHFFATPFLMMKGALEKMNASWETTAAVLGDNWIKTVVRIITPNALPTLLEIFVYLFINGMVTVSAIVFIAGAKTMVITTKIQELQHFAKFNEIFILSIYILFTNLILKSVKGIVNIKLNNK
ncbi:ABC transporter permease [Treponema sp.]|uniref:ABC transporter permease n=1 Tax=Treponema sp. TaxID=166 RepID=UPI00388F8245